MRGIHRRKAPLCASRQSSMAEQPGAHSQAGTGSGRGRSRACLTKVTGLPSTAPWSCLHSASHGWPCSASVPDCAGKGFSRPGLACPPTVSYFPFTPFCFLSSVLLFFFFKPLNDNQAELERIQYKNIPSVPKCYTRAERSGAGGRGSGRPGGEPQLGHRVATSHPQAQCPPQSGQQEKH